MTFHIEVELDMGHISGDHKHIEIEFRSSSSCHTQQHMKLTGATKLHICVSEFVLFCPQTLSRNDFAETDVP
jgi:hypothetical protein